MEKDPYFETKNCRCLDYHHRLSRELWLFRVGLEQHLPGESYGPKRRPGYHLHAILSGEGILEVDGRRTALHAGQLFLLKPGEAVWYAASQERPWTYCWVSFDGEQAGYLMEQAGFGPGVSTVNSYVSTDAFYELAEQLLSRPELDLASDLRRQGLLSQFVALAIESYDRVRHGRQNAGYSTDSYIDHALDFIHSNYDRIKVADISASIGIDRSYLANIFRKRVGVSPQEYLIRVRMRHSCDLLLATDWSIKEIAMRAGYDNALTFSKSFKAFYGVSPKHYREQPEEERVRLPEIPLPWRSDGRHT